MFFLVFLLSIILLTPSVDVPTISSIDIRATLSTGILLKIFSYCLTAPLSAGLMVAIVVAFFSFTFLILLSRFIQPTIIEWSFASAPESTVFIPPFLPLLIRMWSIEDSCCFFPTLSHRRNVIIPGFAVILTPNSWSLDALIICSALILKSPPTIT